MARIRGSSRTARLAVALGLGPIGTAHALADGGLTDPAAVRAMVDAYKKDPLGPYQTLRWFLPRRLDPPSPAAAPHPRGDPARRTQRRVRALALRQHVFLGQILAGTPNDEFLDEALEACERRLVAGGGDAVRARLEIGVVDPRDRLC